MLDGQLTGYIRNYNPELHYVLRATAKNSVSEQTIDIAPLPVPRLIYKDLNRVKSIGNRMPSEGGDIHKLRNVISRKWAQRIIRRLHGPNGPCRWLKADPIATQS
jgi:hypothetical protein